MDYLLHIPGALHVPIFHIYDEKRQPARCELLVAPDLGWAVATQLNEGGPGLVICHQTLAIKVCQLYPIEPERLVLFTRYTDLRTYQNVYSLHFASGGRDLFNEISFVGPTRRAVAELDTPFLLQALQSGEPLPPEWRALQPVAAKGSPAQVGPNRPRTSSKGR
jgi:hypothetical protein